MTRDAVGHEASAMEAEAARECVALRAENAQLRDRMHLADTEIARLRDDLDHTDAPGDHGRFLAAASAFLARIGYGPADFEKRTLMLPTIGRRTTIWIQGECTFQVDTHLSGHTWARWIHLPLTPDQAARARSLDQDLTAALHGAMDQARSASKPSKEDAL